MHVDTNNGVLLYKLRDPARVTSVIPGSSTFTYNGMQITQVPHTLDAVRVLQNLGLQAPSPILHYYPWRGKYTPFPHQAITSAFMTTNRRCIVLNDMGLGKSLSFLWAADYLMDLGIIRKAIIVAPLSTMHTVWANEISTHFMFNRTCAVLHGSRERRLQLLEKDVDFYIINHDGLKTITKELSQREDIDLWGVDEAAAFRNPSTDRFKVLNKLIPEQGWLWMMTGTPCPTAPTDAWALSKLLRNPRSPKYLSAFKSKTMIQITKYKWVPKSDAYKTAYEVLQPGVRFKKKDCLKDLPPVTFQLRKAEMTKQQAALYKEMQSQLVMDVGGDQITAANAAVKLLKLLQVSTGAVYNETNDTLRVNATKRLEVLKELVESSANKVVVFVPFTGALNVVKEFLSKTWSVEVVDGSTSVTDRKRIFHDFQHSKDPRIIVAHPKTAAHGLTLTAADHTIWYAPIFSLEIFEQANNRMDRPGQKFNMTISMIAANRLEMEIYKALYTRQKMQNSVLELYKKEIGMGPT